MRQPPRALGPLLDFAGEGSFHGASSTSRGLPCTTKPRGEEVRPVAFFKTSDGVRIYFEEHGKQGQPILLAYGIGGNAGMWQPNIGPLSARHRLVLWEP